MFDPDISQNEARLQAATLRDLATRTAGTPSWPFVVLDWLTFRRLDGREIQTTEHLHDCVLLLATPTIPMNVALESTIAIAAELLGPDVSGIERACMTLLTERKRDVPPISDEVVSQLRAAGLGAKAIQRLKAKVAEPVVASLSEQPGVSVESTIAEPPELNVKSVMISYSHEGENTEWMRLVRTFSTALRKDFGIPVVFDQYGSHMGKDWSVWGPKAINDADVVLCLASPTYKEDWYGDRESGAADEARMVRAKRREGKSVSFVVLPGRSQMDIPGEMTGPNWFIISSIDAEGLAELLRELTGQPRYPVPELGTPPVLPPEE